jgi:hypothetical protein
MLALILVAACADKHADTSAVDAGDSADSVEEWVPPGPPSSLSLVLILLRTGDLGPEEQAEYHLSGTERADCSLADCAWSMHVTGVWTYRDWEDSNSVDHTRFEYLEGRWDTPGAGFSQDGGSGDLRLEYTLVRIRWTGEGVGVFENVTPGTEEGCPARVSFDTCEVSGDITLTYE